MKEASSLLAAAAADFYPKHDKWATACVEKLKVRSCLVFSSLTQGNPPPPDIFGLWLVQAGRLGCAGGLFGGKLSGDRRRGRGRNGTQREPKAAEEKEPEGGKDMSGLAPTGWW